MKICIVGAGATGGYLGFKLIKAGFDVSLVARGTHLKAMKHTGLTVIENDKEISCFPKCSESMSDLGKMDYIFITLKAYSIPGLVNEITTGNHTNNTDGLCFCNDSSRFICWELGC